ncbi:hypothetical protein ACX0G7_11375 [Flavitalea antarctica]
MLNFESFLYWDSVTRIHFFPSTEHTGKQSTRKNSAHAALLAMSGKRNPYPHGRLGVVEEGAYADLILVDGKPIHNIKLLEDPEKNFLLIMKDGVIYKNVSR